MARLGVEGADRVSAGFGGGLEQGGVVAFFQADEVFFDDFDAFGEVKKGFEDFALGGGGCEFGHDGVHAGDGGGELVAGLAEGGDGFGAFHERGIVQMQRGWQEAWVEKMKKAGSVGGLRPVVFVTCGPAYAPVDGVRRLTNHSTGALGVELARAAAGVGARVVCFRGVGATVAMPDFSGVERVDFGTNDELRGAILRRVEAGDFPDLVLHAAALSDFAVEGGGEGKMESRGGVLELRLVPVAKLLPEFRGWFPAARIVGWKYEVEGDRASALAKGVRQIRECGTDGCVVNGPAYGTGFGWLTRDGAGVHFAEAARLAGALVSGALEGGGAGEAG